MPPTAKLIAATVNHNAVRPIVALNNDTKPVKIIPKLEIRSNLFFVVSVILAPALILETLLAIAQIGGKCYVRWRDVARKQMGRLVRYEIAGV
jgi:hypothetical protein